MMVKTKISMSLWRMQFQTAQPKSLVCPVKPEMKNMDAEDVDQLAGVQNKTLVIRPTKLILAVVVGEEGEEVEVAAVVAVAEVAAEVAAKVAEQKDWASHVESLVEVNDWTVPLQRPCYTTITPKKNTSQLNDNSAAWARKNGLGPLAIIHHPPSKEITEGLSETFYNRLIYFRFCVQRHWLIGRWRSQRYQRILKPSPD
jgi:hypothetical protein